MCNANADLRSEAKSSGVFLWQIAERLRISEPSMTRLFRRELSDEKKEEIRNIIEELKGGEMIEQ